MKISDEMKKSVLNAAGNELPDELLDSICGGILIDSSYESPEDSPDVISSSIERFVLCIIDRFLQDRGIEFEMWKEEIFHPPQNIVEIFFPKIRLCVIFL